MADKPMKRCSTSLVIKEIQSKAKMTHQLLHHLGDKGKNYQYELGLGTIEQS